MFLPQLLNVSVSAFLDMVNVVVGEEFIFSSQRRIRGNIVKINFAKVLDMVD